MFIGHYAVALAAKKPAPNVSLGTLVAAAQFLDLLWPVLVLAGVEHVRIAPGNIRFTPLDFYHYPISHSLVTALAWAAAFAVMYFVFRRRARASIVLALLVFSHWVLDAIAHRPDLPLVPQGARRVGLGLWNSIPGTLMVETLMLAAAVIIYMRCTRPLDRTGRIAPGIFLLVLCAIYLASAFGPPPPDARTVAWAGMGQWLFVLFAWWVDRHRKPSTPR